MKNKNPLFAAFLSTLLPSAGHIYARATKKGLLFLSIETITIGFWLNTIHKVLKEGLNERSYNLKYADQIVPILIFILIITKIWEIVDSYKITKQYNQN